MPRCIAKKKCLVVWCHPVKKIAALTAYSGSLGNGVYYDGLRVGTRHLG